MSFRSNFLQSQRGLYFDQNGDNNNAGNSPELPLGSMQFAINTASNLTPAPDILNPATVTQSQAGEISEPLNLSDSVDVFAEKINLGSVSPTCVVAGNNCDFNLKRLSVSQVNQTGVNITDTLGFKSKIDELIIDGDDATGIFISGSNKNNINNIDNILISGEGATGIHITAGSTNSNPIDLNLESISVNADNVTVFDFAADDANFLADLDLSSVYAEGNIFDSTLFTMSNGQLKVRAGSVDLPNFANMSGDSRLVASFNAFNGNTSITDNAICILDSAAFLTGNFTADNNSLLQLRCSSMFGNVQCSDNAQCIINANTITGNITAQASSRVNFNIKFLSGDLTIDAGANATGDIDVVFGNVTINGNFDGRIGGVYYGNRIQGGSNFGFIDYSDSATSITPISLIANTWTTITNDGLGQSTNTSYPPPGVTQLMNSVGQIDITELSLGDVIYIRNDFQVTPSVNDSLLEFRYELGDGANTYYLEASVGRLDDGSGKPYRKSLAVSKIYVGDLNTRDNPITLQARLSVDGVLTNFGSVITASVK